MDLCETKNVKTGQGLKLEMGCLKLWLVHDQREWRLASEYAVKPAEKIKSEILSHDPKHKDWQRWEVSDQSDSVMLEPGLPDRSVVIRTDHPLRLARSVNKLFFVGIPMWIRITVARTVICEIPSMVLSNTWFGEIEEGELCYAWKSMARQNVEDLDISSFKAFCPVQIRNTTKTPLEYHRLCIHTDHLTLYRSSQRFWTNRLNVTYKGIEHLSHIDLVQSAPSYEKDLTLCREARVSHMGGFMKRTFGSSTHFSGW
jgi:hypothetical protein